MGEKVVWNFELNVVKEYLSKFYSSSFACIREYVANAIAAQFKANVNDPIKVEIYPNRIVIEDKGVGISKKTFREVFMWFGRSENRNVSGIQGMFGLGAKSFMMLTGEKGKMIMKTRSRETNEAYSAILTSYGAEIIDDGGKEDFGTRFEIYPEESLSSRKINSFVEGVRELFDFSRIPIELLAVLEDSDRIELSIDVHNHEIEMLEENEVYEIGILKTVPAHEKWKSWRHDKYAIVLGDVLAKRLMYSSPQGFFLRIKVEDGRTIDLLGQKVRTPVPTPNRDDFKEGHREFTTLMELKYRLILFKRDFSKFLHMSAQDLSSYSSEQLEELQKALNRIHSYLEYSDAIEREIPKFLSLKRTVDLLLTELPAYGVWGGTRRNGRRITVLCKDVIYLAATGRKTGYLKRRPNSKKELDLEDAEIHAAYVDNPEVIEFLEKNGVKEVNLNRERTVKRLKVYRIGNFEREGPHYYTKEELLNEVLEGKPIIYAEKVTDVPESGFPYGYLVVGSKKVYKELKEVLGDLVMTYDEWLEFVKESTLVTDGYTVKTLKQIEKDYVLVEAPSDLIPLIPVVRKIVGEVYALLDVTDTAYAKELFAVEDFVKWLLTRYSSSRLNSDLELLLFTIFNEYEVLKNSNLLKDLTNLACKYAGVERGKTVEELEEDAEPILRSIVKKYGRLRLGKYGMTVDNYCISLENVAFPNPCIPESTIEKAGDEGLIGLIRLKNLFGEMGLLIHHAEKGGSVRTADGYEVTNKELGEIIERWIEAKKDTFRDWEWKALASYAPNVAGLVTLAALSDFISSLRL